MLPTISPCVRLARSLDRVGDLAGKHWWIVRNVVGVAQQQLLCVRTLGQVQRCFRLATAKEAHVVIHRRRIILVLTLRRINIERQVMVSGIDLLDPAGVTPMSLRPEWTVGGPVICGYAATPTNNPMQLASTDAKSLSASG